MWQQNSRAKAPCKLSGICAPVCRLPAAALSSVEVRSAVAAQVMVASGFSPGGKLYSRATHCLGGSHSPSRDEYLCEDVLMAGHVMSQDPSQAATPASQGSPSPA